MVWSFKLVQRAGFGTHRPVDCRLGGEGAEDGAAGGGAEAEVEGGCLAAQRSLQCVVLLVELAYLSDPVHRQLHKLSYNHS